MKNTIRWLLAFGVMLILGAVVSQSVLFGQVEEPAPAEEPAQVEQPGQADSEPVKAIRGLEQEGELRAIDAEKSIFLLVGDDGKEMLFHYDDQTEVTGQTEGVQGLTGQSGLRLQIQYRAEGEKAIAEKIEVTESGPESGEAQSPAQPQASPELGTNPKL